MNTITVNSILDTRKVASKIAERLKGGEVICLYGNLGVGKTYFTKFLGEALGIQEEEIISPTFVYFRKYQGKKLSVNHFDFYRVKDKDDICSIGFRDALEDSQSITVIEWPSNIASHLPEERLEIYMDTDKGEVRKFTIKPIGRDYNRFKNITLLRNTQGGLRSRESRKKAQTLKSGMNRERG